MLKIVIPSNNLQERKYLLDIVFTQFLRIPYTCTISSKNINEYQIYKGEKKIILKDAFFSSFSQDLDYLNMDSIPKRIHYFSHSLLLESQLPILFGRGEIEIKNKTIISHIDIFAGIFFMLTRWEEYVNPSRDQHQRFQAKDSLAYQHGFLDRPIVNEYLEFLWNMFEALEFNEKRYKHTFSMKLTHDVDEILAYPNVKKILKRVVGDVVVRKSLPLAYEKLCDYTAMIVKNRKDPYDTFEEIMDLSEKFNLKFHFFFMSGGTTRYDNYYDVQSPSVKKLMDKIQARGHYIGLHPSYNAYNNKQQFKLEKDTLEFTSKSKIVSGREHYLRFEVPTTWQIWEESEMLWCSNMAYADATGFRAGTCYAYTPFNILSREQLTIKERPLSIMEVTLMGETIDDVDFENEINKYLNIVKKYAGEFVFLWHNSNFKVYENFSRSKMKDYSSVYQKTLQKATGLEV